MQASHLATIVNSPLFGPMNQNLLCSVQEARERALWSFTKRARQADQVNKVRILIADDHPHFPELVESLLGPTFEVIGKVNDGRALCEAALDLKPDVIITDISMPVLNGIESVGELRRAGCTSKVIFLTVHSDPDFVQACLATGAVGYIFKPRVAVDLFAAIREALAGNVFVSRFDIQESHA
jgi:DNA-binding NarL/FixJ family response regulator